MQSTVGNYSDGYIKDLQLIFITRMLELEGYVVVNMVK